MCLRNARRRRLRHRPPRGCGLADGGANSSAAETITMHACGRPRLKCTSAQQDPVATSTGTCTPTRRHRMSDSHMLTQAHRSWLALWHELGMNRPARRCTNGARRAHAHAEEVTLREDGKYRKPSVLVARAYRNWHSPRDHDEYERRKKLAKSKGRPMKHILKVTEAMKANENFDFDEHPELDWPMYNCCEVRLGRHCPECFVWNQCCRCIFDPCGEENKEHGGSDWAGHFGVGHDLYFKYLKLLGFTFLFMALIMLPSMVINSYGAQPTDTSGLQLYQLSLGNLGATGLNNDTIRLPCDLGPASILYDSLPACEWDRLRMRGSMDFRTSLHRCYF